MFLNTLPVTKTISFYVTISIGMNILIISENFQLVCPQYDIQDDLWKPSDSEIEIEKINSTSLNVTWAEEKNGDGTYNDGYYYAHLRYGLNLAELIHLRPLNTCNNTHKPVYVSAYLKEDIESCKQELERFDSERADILNSYCDWKEVSINDTIVISDLLPSQLYYFYRSVQFKKKNGVVPVDTEKFVTTVCMDEAEPFYPPQTDLGSFKVINTPHQAGASDFDDRRKVELYWRPVPRLLAGSWTLSYTITCSNQEDKSVEINETIFDIKTGKKGIERGLAWNSTYLCVLRSKNQIGESRNNSEIIIPKHSNMIDTKSKFQFYVAEIVNGEYLIKWTNLESLLSNNKSMKGIYTVYWCRITSPGHGCVDIEALEQTSNEFLTLLLDGDGRPQNRIFGISYRSIDNKFFTGITWAECIAQFRTQAQSVYDPIEIHTPGPSDDTAIKISWSYRGCRSIIALVQHFEIDHCIIRQVDPCSPLTPESLNNSELLSYRFNDTRLCKSVALQNELTTGVTLNSLNASTLYAIRIKHRLANGTTNQWSNPVYALTLAEPIKAKECSARLWNISKSVAIMLVALMTTGMLCIYIRRKLSHYWSLASQIRKVETQLPQRIDDKLNEKIIEAANDSNDIGLKFWSNRFPDHTSLSGSSMKNSESSLDSDEDICDDRNSRTNNSPPNLVTDYIPNRLMTGYVEQNPATMVAEVIDENHKDNMSVDDNSVGSQESFLRTIAEEQVKNTDQGTHSSIL